MLRRAFLTLCFGIALVGNPGVACGPSDDSSDFEYTEADMEEAVIGTYSGTATVSETTESVTLTLSRPAAASGSAPAGLRPQCGSRTFVKPASACASISTMEITGELVSDGNAIASAELTGQFMASLILSGDLELSGSGARLHAQYRDGAFVEWQYTAPDGTLVPLELTRQ